MGNKNNGKTRLGISMKVQQNEGPQWYVTRKSRNDHEVYLPVVRKERNARVFRYYGKMKSARERHT